MNETSHEECVCSVVGLSGARYTNTTINYEETKLLCASTSQVNIVSAMVRRDKQGALDFNITRLPGHPNYLRADYWFINQEGADTVYYTWDPIDRYTLNDDPGGSTTHYIVQYSSRATGYRSNGPANSGTALSTTGFKS
ncbi:hypothetical protein CPB86DRAFT_817638 [Serendipita vermifera]|nr:hypothetical protein CPB86DRAFT_817638 [Serendipita vermifera]